MQLSPKTKLSIAVEALMDEQCSETAFVEWAIEMVAFRPSKLGRLLPLVISEQLSGDNYKRIEAAWSNPNPSIRRAMHATPQYDLQAVDGFTAPSEPGGLPAATDKTSTKQTDSAAVGLIVLLIIAAAVSFLTWSSWTGSKPEPSDDPYYDAPIGRTFGGDTY